MDGGGEIVIAMAADGAEMTPDEGESSSVESTSDVLSHALDILDISTVTNEKPRGSRPRSSNPRKARRNNPPRDSYDNILISFPTCAKVTTAHNVSAVYSSTGERRPKLMRLGSIDSISTVATISTSASFEVSPLPSPTGSPECSPKRSIFKPYWNKEDNSKETTTRRFSFSSVPKAKKDASTSGLDLLPSTSDGSTSTADVSSASAAYTTAFQSSATSAVPSTTAGIKTSSPQRSIFGDRAMKTAQRSSLPDLPSIAATFISETRQVHKTASTGQLIKVRKSCLRRTALYSSSSSRSNRRGQMRKSASTTTTTITTEAPAPSASGPLGRTRADSAVHFDPTVRVYEFHRTDNHHHDRRSSNDWSSHFT